MILKGSQRGHGAQLAAHLLNAHDNDHIEVHQLRGFLAEDLEGAFSEIEATALGTRSVQPFFSVSINPPAEGSAQLTDKGFRAAAHRIELANGLQGQPRAIVIHEKDGRRHAHIVWSRIDAQTMTAKNLAHFKRKLMGVSRELFLEHGFDLPDGFKDREQASPHRVDLAEWQAAKRRGRNAIDQKQLIRQCWERSDSKVGFAAALSEHGYALARGDRRGHVVVTADGQVIAVGRAVGIKTKEVRAKLGEAEALPSVAQARQALAAHASSQSVRAATAVRADLSEARKALEVERTVQITAHRTARKTLKTQQADRRATARAALHRGGLSGLWDRLLRSGQVKNERRALEARLTQQDRAEWQELRQAQLTERRALEVKRTALRKEAFGLIDDLRIERDGLMAKVSVDPDLAKGALRDGFTKAARSDPRQLYVAPKQSGPVTDAQIRDNPERLLERLSYFEAAFDARDISRALIAVLPTPGQAIAAKKEVLAASEMFKLDGTPPRYTTRSYVRADTHLQSTSRNLLATCTDAPTKAVVRAALAKQNRDLRDRHGVSLSAEQENAVIHMTNSSRLSMVVGRAGTGKSTILAAAHDAWERAGLCVHGAALSGKAAAGLSEASGIASRTLASLELSWANGNDPIKPGDVLAVDEAGMIGTRQLDRIAGKIDEIGAKLVLVGDPDQLPPIEAGEPFRGLTERHGASHLTEIHRQSADWQKQATSDLAAGRISEAVTIHKSQGITVDKTYVLASRSMDDPLAYVAMSRHRADMRLYVCAEDRPDWMHGPLQRPQPDRGQSRRLEL